MNPRRSFLAMVGGLAIGGPVMARTGFAQPTLILPPGLTILPKAPGAESLLTLQHIQRSIPEDAFRSLPRSSVPQIYGGRDEQVVQAAIDKTVTRHGGILAAMKAGAI